jgi:hypothetical protein
MLEGGDWLAVVVRWLVRQVERQRIANASTIHDEQKSYRSQRSRDDASRFTVLSASRRASASEGLHWVTGPT